MKHFDEPIDVSLVIVDVRADAHPTKPRCHVDILGRQALNQSFRHSIAEAETQNVGRPDPRLGDIRRPAA